MIDFLDLAEVFSNMINSSSKYVFTLTFAATQEDIKKDREALVQWFNDRMGKFLMRRITLERS